MPSSEAMLPVLQWAGRLHERRGGRKDTQWEKSGSYLASAPVFTKPSPFMHFFLCKDLGKKGEASGEMEWVQAIEMTKGKR